jgi:hypothetical protein
MRSSAAQLRLLRAHRALPKGRDTGIAGEVRSLMGRLGAAGRGDDAITNAWEELAPPGLRDRARVVSLSRGVLNLRVSDASARFEVDRWLRAGGQARLARACGRGISRVRFTM